MREAEEVHYFHGERAPVESGELPEPWQPQFEGDIILRDKRSYILIEHDSDDAEYEVRFIFDEAGNIQIIYPGGSGEDELCSRPISPDEGRNKIDDTLANLFNIT